MNLYSRDKLCSSCYDKRIFKASSNHRKDISYNNWDLYFVLFLDL